MKRVIAVLALAGSTLWAAMPGTPKVSRQELAGVEKAFDNKIERHSVQDPFLLLGTTRGVYLEGYGAVFTAEVNLIVVPPLSPFRPKLSDEMIAQLREKKMTRVPVMKQLMREMLVASASSLNTVSSEERIVLGVTLFRFSWEASEGIPLQIIMSAPRKILLDYSAGRVPASALEEAIQLQEL